MENIYINMPSPISTDTIILCAGLFVLIIIAMMFGSSELVPSYGFETKKLEGHPYEGFAQAMDYYHNRENTEGFVSLGSADYGDAYVAKQIAKGGDTTSAFNYGVPKKVTGFDGIQGDPAAENSGLMGYLAMNPAQIDCKDYGYTKSTGRVCFSPEDVRLLTTRGGNAK